MKYSVYIVSFLRLMLIKKILCCMIFLVLLMVNELKENMVVIVYINEYNRILIVNLNC